MHKMVVDQTLFYHSKNKTLLGLASRGLVEFDHISKTPCMTLCVVLHYPQEVEIGTEMGG